MKIVRLIALALLLVLALPSIASAMAGMYTAKYVDGPNIILLTNNVHDTRADLPITYNLRIYDIDGKPVNFGNIQIELKQGDKVSQTYNVRRTVNGDGNLELRYPRQGTYTISTRFLDNDKQVARGEFPIIVAKNPDQGWLTSLLSLPTLVGLVVGASAATLYSKRNKLSLPKTLSKRKR